MAQLINDVKELGETESELAQLNNILMRMMKNLTAGHFWKTMPQVA